MSWTATEYCGRTGTIPDVNGGQRPLPGRPLLRRLLAACALGFLLLGPLSAVAAQQAHRTQLQSASGAPVVQRDGFAQLSERRGPLVRALVTVQQRVHATLREIMSAVRGGGTEVWMVLVVLGLFYGVIHSLLPGHRKMLLFSYFLSQDAPLRHGVIAGVTLGILHALTALTVVGVGYHLLQLSLSATVEQATGLISRITAACMVLLGVALLIVRFREVVVHGAYHHHGDVCAHATWRGRALGDSGFLSALIVSGIVPCPGATMILLLAVALAAFPAGVVVVASMSVGMALTLSLLAAGTILFKARMKVMLASERGHRMHVVLESAAAAVIVIFGVVLLMTPAL